MTDYLECQEEETADVLWEAVRRLRDLPAGWNESKPFPQTAETEETAAPAGLLAAEGEAAEPFPRLPLLDGVLALDGAVERAGSALRWEARKTAGILPETEGVHSDDWADRRPWLGASAQRDGSRAWAEETAHQRDVAALGRSTRFGEEATMQAEQLDRVFRRDSRRYDGGFFLY